MSKNSYFQLLTFILALLVAVRVEALEESVQSELSWRAHELSRAISELRRGLPSTATPIVEVQKLADTADELVQEIQMRTATLSSIGQRIDATIRASMAAKQALPASLLREGPSSTRWIAVLDALDNMQGQFASVRERSSQTVSGSDSPVGNSEATARDPLLGLVRAMKTVNERASHIVTRSEDRRLLVYLSDRLQFVRSSAGESPLFQREVVRLREDVQMVRTMLQRYSYDEELGQAWRFVRDGVDQLGALSEERSGD